MYIFMTLYSMM